MYLDAYQKAAIKNAAKAISHHVSARETIEKKIAELQKQLEEKNLIIEGYDKTSLEITGYKVMDLVVKSGNNWVFKYPDTIVPPTDGAQVAGTDPAQPETEQPAQPAEETPEIPEAPEEETPTEEVPEQEPEVEDPEPPMEEEVPQDEAPVEEPEVEEPQDQEPANSGDGVKRFEEDDFPL